MSAAVILTRGGPRARFEVTGLFQFRDSHPRTHETYGTQPAILVSHIDYSRAPRSQMKARDGVERGRRVVEILERSCRGLQPSTGDEEGLLCVRTYHVIL